MGWKRLVRDFFTYNAKERKQLLGLLTILFVIVLVRLIYGYFPQNTLDQKNQDKWVAYVKDHVEARPSIESNSDRAYHYLTLDSFYDPNLLSLEAWVDLGMPLFMANRTFNYTEKGGVFREVNDLKRIYDIDTSWCNHVIPFLRISLDSSGRNLSSVVIEKPEEKETEALQQSVKVNLNTADSNQLLDLKGVGAFYVKEIIELRQNLGGIRDYSQLLMIYKMKDESIDLIASQTFIDSDDFQYINLNTVDINQLGRHPYLSWKQAKTIVNYRFQHGPFKAVEDIKRTNVINDSVYFNIQPYLVIE